MTGDCLLTTMPGQVGLEFYANETIGPKDLKVGLTWTSEDMAVDAILRWGEATFCPLVKARRDKGLDETNGLRRGRRCLECSHGRRKNKYEVKGE